MGSPVQYEGQLLVLRTGTEVNQREALGRLIDMQYERNDMELSRGKFRVKGDTIEIHPAYEETIFKVSLFGDEVEKISEVDPVTGDLIKELDELVVFPATHYMADTQVMSRAIKAIEIELQQTLKGFEKENKLLESQRLRMRTDYDLEMMSELGFCSGIENYLSLIHI